MTIYRNNPVFGHIAQGAKPSDIYVTVGIYLPDFANANDPSDRSAHKLKLLVFAISIEIFSPFLFQPIAIAKNMSHL